MRHLNTSQHDTYQQKEFNEQQLLKKSYKIFSGNNKKLKLDWTMFSGKLYPGKEFDKLYSSFNTSQVFEITNKQVLENTPPSTSRPITVQNCSVCILSRVMHVASHLTGSSFTSYLLILNTQRRPLFELIDSKYKYILNLYRMHFIDLFVIG